MSYKRRKDMSAKNNFQVIGNLGKDPEIKTSKNGNTYTNFSVCSNKRYKDDQGNTQTKETWFNPVMYGKGAETFAKIAKKGRQVLLQGELTVEKREVTINGEKKNISTIGMVVKTFELLGKRTDGDSDGSTYSQAAPSTEAPQESGSPDDFDVDLDLENLLNEDGPELDDSDGSDDGNLPF